MTLSPEMQQMAAYIAREVVRRPVQIEEDTPLVSSGLLDSLALVDILLKLEKVTGRRIPAGKSKLRTWTHLG